MINIISCNVLIRTYSFRIIQCVNVEECTYMTAMVRPSNCGASSSSLKQYCSLVTGNTYSPLKAYFSTIWAIDLPKSAALHEDGMQYPMPGEYKSPVVGLPTFGSSIFFPSFPNLNPSQSINWKMLVQVVSRLRLWSVPSRLTFVWLSGSGSILKKTLQYFPFKCKLGSLTARHSSNKPYAYRLIDLWIPSGMPLAVDSFTKIQQKSCQLWNSVELHCKDCGILTKNLHNMYKNSYQK